MGLEGENLLAAPAHAGKHELFTGILTRPGCRVERIVSHGRVTPPDQPYVQPHNEWVLLHSGVARVEAGVETALVPCDHLLIPAGTSRRITFTAPDRPTVWLAIFCLERIV